MLKWEKHKNMIIYVTLITVHTKTHFQIWSAPPVTGYTGPINTSVTYKYDDPKTYKGPVIKGK
jgi:hypothetical protein